MVQLLSHCFGFDMLAHVMISIGVINRYVIRVGLKLKMEGVEET